MNSNIVSVFHPSIRKCARDEADHPPLLVNVNVIAISYFIFHIPYSILFFFSSSTNERNLPSKCSHECNHIPQVPSPFMIRWRKVMDHPLIPPKSIIRMHLHLHMTSHNHLNGIYCGRNEIQVRQCPPFPMRQDDHPLFLLLIRVSFRT